MKVNPEKFQAIGVNKNCKKDSYPLYFKNQSINSENCVKLFGIKIDHTQ